MSAPATDQGATPVGVAVIGLGVIGRRMLEQAALQPQLHIVGAWDRDPAARERYGRAARARVEATYSWPVITDQWLDIIEHIIQKQRS